MDKLNPNVLCYKRLLIALMLLCVSSQINAQALHFGFDSVTSFKNIQPDASLDGFSTNIRSHDVALGGYHIGMQWQNKYKAGIGYYFLASSVDEYLQYQLKQIKGRLRFSYIALYGENIFYNSPHWEFRYGLKLWGGLIYNKYFLPTGDNIHLGTHFYLITSPYLTGQYKILYWLGLSGSLGYQIPVPTNIGKGGDANASYVDFSVVIFFGELYKRYLKDLVEDSVY